jgi:hypothetical protein
VCHLHRPPGPSAANSPRRGDPAGLAGHRPAARPELTGLAGRRSAARPELTGRQPVGAAESRRRHLSARPGPAGRPSPGPAGRPSPGPAGRPSPGPAGRPSPSLAERPNRPSAAWSVVRSRRWPGPPGTWAHQRTPDGPARFAHCRWSGRAEPGRQQRPGPTTIRCRPAAPGGSPSPGLAAPRGLPPPGPAARGARPARPSWPGRSQAGARAGPALRWACRLRCCPQQPFRCPGRQSGAHQSVWPHQPPATRPACWRLARTARQRPTLVAIRRLAQTAGQRPTRGRERRHLGGRPAPGGLRGHCPAERPARYRQPGHLAQSPHPASGRRPRSGPNQPRSGRSRPRSCPNRPRCGQNQPRSGRSRPRSGPNRRRCARSQPCSGHCRTRPAGWPRLGHYAGLLRHAAARGRRPGSLPLPRSPPCSRGPVTLICAHAPLAGQHS